MNADPNQPTPPAANAPLQFDRAEIPADQVLTCASCKAPIAGEYYQVNGQVICPACREQVAKYGTGGSGAVRFVRATVAGVAAGIVGFIIYYAVLELTKINFGLIAVVVGWMIGNAVRWGSERRGGPLYQCLALGLTYVAICATYIPWILRGSESDLPMVVKVIAAFVASLAEPWLEGPSNIIGWLIIVFGLYEAWILNRKVSFEVTGPFFARQAAPPAAS